MMSVGHVNQLCQKAPNLVAPELNRPGPETEGQADWVPPWQRDRKDKPSDLVGFAGEDEPSPAVMAGFALDETDAGQLHRRPD